MTRTRLPQSDWRYARLLVTPVGTNTTIKPIDSISVLFLVSKCLGEWFGAMGGTASAADVTVVSCDEQQTRLSSQEGSREAILRFPAPATPSLITALPVASHNYDGQAYHITVLQHSSNLASLSGTAGRGAKGWSEWMTGLQLNQQDNGSAMYIENL